jgi:hypothetical protein
VGYIVAVSYKLSNAICTRQHTILWYDHVARNGSISYSSSHTVLSFQRLSKSGYLLVIRWDVWKSYKALIAVEMPVNIEGQRERISEG